MTKDVTDMPPVHTKTSHFCRQISKTVGIKNGTLTGTFWQRHCVNTRKWCKQNIFWRFWNENDRFLGCRYISLTSKSYKEFLTVKFPSLSNCSGIVWTLAQILLPSHFSSFSKCAGIVWTQSKDFDQIFLPFTLYAHGHTCQIWSQKLGQFFRNKMLKFGILLYNKHQKHWSVDYGLINAKKSS